MAARTFKAIWGGIRHPSGNGFCRTLIRETGNLAAHQPFRPMQAGDLVVLRAYPEAGGKWVARPGIVIRAFTTGNITVCGISGPGKIFRDRHTAIGANAPQLNYGCRYICLPPNVLKRADPSFILLGGTLTLGVNTPSPTAVRKNWVQPIHRQGSIASINPNDVVYLQSWFCGFHCGSPPSGTVYFGGYSGVPDAPSGVPGAPSGVPGAPNPTAGYPSILFPDGYFTADLDEDGVGVTVKIAEESDDAPTPAELLTPPAISPSEWEEDYGYVLSEELPGPDSPGSLIVPPISAVDYQAEFGHLLGDGADLPP